ncbi:GNAT family N-acetyltransferase [Spirillospora sp. CA-294931]|uniref:GNAT family N-acetyltransferase n=1 Tax=Spirillospora sp. CA-294931 TaxID=3240042 RepID=UPI003D915AAD
MSKVRRAEETDVPELVRLRSLLFETLRGDFFNPPGNDIWRENLTTSLKQDLTKENARILVVDAEVGLAACAVGTYEVWLPSPSRPNGRMGSIIGVVTDPSHRRQGHSRALMQALQTWFRENDVRRVDLHASPESEGLYRSLGFTDHPDPSLTWRP